MIDEELVGKIRQGDEAAFSTIYRRYIKMIFGFVANKINDLATCEDVTQEVWLAMVKSLDHFGGQSSFKNWLFGITKHKIMDYYQEKYSFKRWPLTDIALEQVEEGENKESQLAQVLAKLPQREAEVLNLRFLRGYSLSETAQELALSVANVKVIQQRALRKAAKYGN